MIQAAADLSGPRASALSLSLPTPTHLALDWHGSEWTITCRMGSRQLMVEIDCDPDSYSCGITLLSGTELTAEEEYRIESWAIERINASCDATAEAI